MAQIDLAIGLPFGGRLVHPLWALSLKMLDVPLNTQQTIIMEQNKPVCEARNNIIERAQELGAKFLFFIDDDVLVPKQTIMGLGWLLANNPDVMLATGIYVTKTEYCYPVLFKDGHSGPYTNWQVNDQFEVDGCGAGCLLINLEVLKHLEKPYFREPQYYEEVDGQPRLAMVSEDMYFCQSVRKAGFKIMAHGAMLCPHYDEKAKKFYTLREDSLPFKKEKARQEKEMAEAEVK